MSDYTKPLPDIEDPTSAPYWAGAKAHKLVMQRCPNCSYVRFPPKKVCPECLTFSDNWVELPPNGVLQSYVTYDHAFDPRFQDDLPYTVGYIKLDDGPRTYGTLLGDRKDFAIGARVRAVFDDVTPDATLVRWELAS
ncbi:MAG: Zn-ribbon domain-containing OB-fold protein [Chloroflexi bacterium]|nr:Zn-ribbon domain-containing OB-fold protein [Chloroflexota bacterium]